MIEAAPPRDPYAALPFEPYAESRRLKLWVEIVLCCQFGRPLPADDLLMALMHDAGITDLERAFDQLVAMERLGRQRNPATGARSVRVPVRGGFTAWTPWPVRQPVPMAAE